MSKKKLEKAAILGIAGAVAVSSTACQTPGLFADETVKNEDEYIDFSSSDDTGSTEVNETDVSPPSVTPSTPDTEEPDVPVNAIESVSLSGYYHIEGDKIVTYKKLPVGMNLKANVKVHVGSENITSIKIGDTLKDVSVGDNEVVFNVETLSGYDCSLVSSDGSSISMGSMFDYVGLSVSGVECLDIDGSLFKVNTSLKEEGTYYSEEDSKLYHSRGNLVLNMQLVSLIDELNHTGKVNFSSWGLYGGFSITGLSTNGMSAELNLEGPINAVDPIEAEGEELYIDAMIEGWYGNPYSVRILTGYIVRPSSYYEEDSSIDSVIEDFTYNAVEFDGQEYIVEDQDITFKSKDLQSGLKSVSVSCYRNESGEAIDLGLSSVNIDSKTKQFSFNTASLPSTGSYSIDVSVTDNVGNVSTGSRVIYIVREDAVTVAEQNGAFFVKDGKTYVNSDGFKFKLSTAGSDTVCDVSNAESQSDGSYLVTGGSCVATLGSLDGYKKPLVFLDGVANDFVIDSVFDRLEYSTFTGETKVGSDRVNYITKDGDLIYHVEDSLSGIRSISVTSPNKGDLVYEFDSSESVIRVNTSQFDSDEDVLIQINAEDNVGNTATISDEIKLFRRELIPSVASQSPCYGKDGVTYAKGSFVFSLEDYDRDRITGVSLLKDGEVYQQAEENGSFTISDSGEYSLEVTTLLGNKVYDLPLKNNLGSIFVIDNAIDNFEYLGFSGKEVEGIDGKVYITTDGVLSYKIEDFQSGIKSVIAELSDGTALESSYNEETGVVSINTNQLSGSKAYRYVIELQVEDNVGNVERFEGGTINDYRVKENITVKSQDECFSKDGKNYINSNFNFVLNNYNSSRIEKVELLKDGELYSDVSDCIGTISDTGSYSLGVQYTIGYEEIPLVFDVISSEFVFDDAIDSVTYSGTSANEVTGSDSIVYINKDGNLHFNVKDNLSGISRITVTDVNGDNLKHSYNEVTGRVSVPTSQFEDGEHTVIIAGYDNVGNSKTLRHTINTLRVVPEITGVRHSSVVNYLNSTYVNKELSLTISKDRADKIDSVQILNNGEVCSDFNGNVGVIAESGNFTIVVTDVAGGTRVYKLSELYEDLQNDVVYDVEKPTVSIDLNGDVISDNWVTGDAMLNFTFSDNEYLKEGRVEINGKEFSYDLSGGKKVSSHSINLKTDVPTANDGRYDITISAVDIAGTESNVYTRKVYFDYNAPVVSAVVSGSYNEFDGVTYVDGTLTVKDNGSTDIGSGLSKIELIKDGKVVESGTSGASFVIRDDGEYSIRVTDNAGLSTTKQLSDFMGESESSIIKIDSDSPIVEKSSGFNPDLTKDGSVWFKSYPTFTYNITDKYINTVSIKVNGDEKVSKINESGSYRVSTDGYTGSVVISVIATDKYGHVTTDSYSYRTDLNAPTISNGVLSGNYEERGGVLFFKKNPTVSVSAVDTETGIASFNLGGAKTETNKTGTFELGTGSYTMEIIDNIGNSTGAVPIKDICNLPSNDFIVDGVAPVISAKRPSGDVDGWFSKDVTYSASLSDNQGIKSATIKMNGEVVASYTSENITTTTAEISANTSKAKADSNGMYAVEVDVVDNAGNSRHWSDSIYIDRVAPKVEEFVFTGDGYQEGVNIGGSDAYGFYFTGKASCKVKVSDGSISSGMNKLYVTLESSDGAISTKTLDIKGGYASFNLPDNFKGFVSAYATDKVENKGKVAKPDGVVSEDSNTFINNLTLGIKMPDTSYQDAAGYPLYSGDVSADATIGCGYSGIKQVTWGVGESTLGTINVDNKGNLSGDSASIKSKGKNLVLRLSESLKLSGNENDMKVWVNVVDRAGRTSKADKMFSIDKDIPELSVDWNTTEADNFYNTSRVATLTIKERNFDPSAVHIEGDYGVVSNWSESGKGVWVSTISFDSDGEYQFTAYCVDRAGNTSEKYSSESFTIDKTAPTMSVNWDNNDVSNSKYYKKGRTATVTVVEKNFDPSLYSVTGEGASIGGWSNNGDTHTASVSFNSDGVYSFTIKGMDKSDNVSEEYSSGEFIVDTSVPEILISGVQDGVSYKKDVGLSVEMKDEYIDIDNSSVVLTGKRNGELRITGSLNNKTGVFTFNEFPEEESYDDIYTLNVNVVDLAGNTIEDSIVFSVNRFGSVYSFENQGILNKYINKAEDISVIETNVDKLDISKAKVVVLLDGEEIEYKESDLSIKESDSPDGKYLYTYTLNKGVFSKDGKYIIQVYSCSVDSTKYSSLSEEYAFILDTTAPDIIVSGVEEDGSYHEYERLVTVDVREVSGIKNIKIELNGEEVVPNTENGVYNFTVKESGSRQNIHVYVEDMAGNVSEVDIGNFIITTNWVSYFVNQSWFRWVVGSVSTLFLLILLLIFKRRKDKRSEEEDILRESAELYKTSSSSYSGDTGKDEVEELDKR